MPDSQVSTRVPPTWRYVLAVATVGVLGTALTIGLMLLVRHNLEENAKTVVRNAVSETSMAAGEEIGELAGQIQSVEGLIAVTDKLDQRTYATFVRRSLDTSVSAFAPLIDASQRTRFERQLAKAGQPMGIHANGVAAPQSPRYLPIQFAVVPGRRTEALGIDLLQAPELQDAIATSLLTGDATATPVPPTAGMPEFGLLISAPVDVAGRVNGVSIGMVGLGALMEQASRADPTEVALSLSLNGQTVWTNGATADSGTRADSVLAGQYVLTGAATPALATSGGTWQPWAVLVAGLLATGLITTVLWKWLDARRIRATADDLQEAKDRLMFLAERDRLTGLPHRDGLLGWLDSWDARDPERPLGLILIDLDGFKDVNTAWGHPVGDQVLQQIGYRLSIINDGRDSLVARLGGDEFVVLRALDRGSIDGLVTMVQTLIGEPITVNERDIQITSSMGVVIRPEDGRSLDTLLACADVALRTAKADVGDSVARFDPVMAMQRAADRNLAKSLRSAMRHPNRNFHIAYQPQVDMRTGEFVAAEALLRWPGPGGEMISPDRFIPLAREHGLMPELGAWVLGQACRTAQHWSARGVPIAVNVDARQLTDGFGQQLEAELQRGKLSPESLLVEVTETASMLPGAKAELERVRDLGVFIAIDDFGTGYSSLSRLADLPAHQLKIDRDFVSGLGTSTEALEIVRTIAALASALRLEVVAEGVETVEQAEILLAEGVYLAQGFWFAEPMSAEKLKKVWDRGAARVEPVT